MGSIAARLSDVTIATSDNPRTEDPGAILDEVFTGIPATAHARRFVDRRTAIENALDEAREGDIVLLAGKGHEDYQVVGSEKVHFDDHEEVQRWLKR
jgi:UDP-N-acetylmuramoyl-L-alanyl-D-glutamate--2,6-diaminopimelate ligase